MKNLGPMPADDGTMDSLRQILRWLRTALRRIHLELDIRPADYGGKARLDCWKQKDRLGLIRRAVRMLLRVRPMGSEARLETALWVTGAHLVDLDNVPE